MTVVRDGVPILQAASGTTIGGDPATSASPMVVASVGKLLTALAIARLEQAGQLSVDGTVPWARLWYTPDPRWNDVTVRELLDHTSGMPVSRSEWFKGGLDCWAFLPTLLGSPPRGHRGEWTYSNGNYCALGLLVSAVTLEPLDVAVQRLVLDDVGASGLRLSTDGAQAGDVAYALGLERLSRLGGAGAYLVSTDALATVLAHVTSADRRTLAWPGVMIDQYGWGHTGTIDRAKACAWVLEDGRTAVAVTVAGGSPSTGGGVCDRVVPAVAADLGVGASGPPERTPP